MTSLTSADFTRFCNALLDVTSTVAAWLSGPVWESAPGAQAEIDIRTTSAFPAAANTWGDSPIRTAFTAAGLMCHAAIEHANAATAVLSATSGLVIPLDTLTRGALEAASQAWWLLDPAIDGRTRVIRCFLLRYGDAAELAGVAAKMNKPGAMSDYGQTCDQLTDSYITTLGFPPITGRGNVRDLFRCGGQVLPSHSVLVEQFMSETLGDSEHNDASGLYAYFCGASHSQLWRLMQARSEIPGPDDQTVLSPGTAAEPVEAAVRGLVHACLEPAMRAAILFGWNSKLYDECDELITRVNERLR
jgi:hypothetical protein